MKPRNPIHLLLFVPVLITGCHFGEERTEIRGNGQGGVEVKYVPNDRPTDPIPQVTPPTATTDEQTRKQQQIEQLQSQVRQQDEEIRRLKGLPPTQPATQP
jgi:hypothetical protein